MGSPITDLAGAYRVRYGEPVSSAVKLRDLYSNYVRLREDTLLDAAAASLAIDALFFSDQIDFSSVTSQMNEAFARAYPSQDLAERLEELGELERDSNEVTGFLANWKGIYHEILVRDRFNSSQQVGSVVLKEGQRAVLPEQINQPGLDLRILNADGTEDSVLQAKATNEIGLISEALMKYPDIQIAATDEVAAQVLDQRVFASGFDNEELWDQVIRPMEDVWDSPVEDLIEQVLPGLPFVIIATTEGTMVLLGKQPFQDGLDRATRRGVKTLAAVGVGAMMALMGAGVFSLPSAFLTRFGIDRYRLLTQLAKRLDADRDQLLAILG